MAAANPALAQMMARQLIGKIAGAGAPSAGGPPTGPGGPLPPPPGMIGQGGPDAGGQPSTPAGLQLSQQLSELQGADPEGEEEGEVA